MARFMQLKAERPSLKQDQISKELGVSSSTVKRYRNDINMSSPYRSNNSGRKRPRLTPNDPKTNVEPQNNNTKSSKRKSKNMQGGSINIPQSDIVIDEDYLDNIINK